MPAIDPQLRQLYAQAVQRPETREIMDYLTARGVDPRSSQSVAPMPMQVSDSKLITVDELVYDLTQRASHELRMQQQEQPSGRLAQSAQKMATRGAPDRLSGATDMRVLIDLALREQRANPQAQRQVVPMQQKKVGML